MQAIFRVARTTLPALHKAREQIAWPLQLPEAFRWVSGRSRGTRLARAEPSSTAAGSVRTGIKSRCRVF
jgi:hypothetical protein